MRNMIVKTKNVQQTLELVKNLREKNPSVPGLGLIYSDPGLGKTETCSWLVGRKGSNAKYVRAKANISPRWLMEMIVAELDEEPKYRYSDLFGQAKEKLIKQDVMLLVDEIDFCCRDTRVLESLRDLHDECGTPIVLIGMGKVDRQLKRHPHFFSRISQIYRFEPLDGDDVAAAVRELCEVELTKDACKALQALSEGSFRSVKIILSHLEAMARRTGLAKLDAEHVNGLEGVCK